MIPDTDTELVADFRAWLATRNPDEVYQYVDNQKCAFAQYLRVRAPRAEINVGIYSFSINDATRVLPSVIDHAVGDPWKSIHTFGHALQRLDELLAENSG
jgi:hypothetical protein